MTAFGQQCKYLQFDCYESQSMHCKDYVYLLSYIHFVYSV